MKKQTRHITLIGLTLLLAYEIKPGGVLDGIWGGSGAPNLGTERAVKQR